MLLFLLFEVRVKLAMRYTYYRDYEREDDSVVYEYRL